MIRYGAYATRQKIPQDAPAIRPVARRVKIAAAPAVQPKPDVITARRIADLVGQALMVPTEDILSERQDRFTVRARQIAMYIAKTHLRCSYARVARSFIRDHTTVLHAVRQVAHRVKTEPETAFIVSNIMKAMEPA